MGHPSSPLLRRRALNELAQIKEVETIHAKRWAVIPLQAEEPVGVDRLRQFIHGKRSGQ